jgi:hypothetical protein
MAKGLFFHKNMKQFCFAVPTYMLRMALLSCLVFAAGCGGSSDTIPVHGSVTLDGKPLPGAVILYQPNDVGPNKPSRTAQGTIMTDGTYSMSSYQPNDGVLPGEYTVVIANLPPTVAFDQFSKAPPTPAGPKIPAIYMDPSRTPLKATVPTSGGTQEINFEMKSQ